MATKSQHARRYRQVPVLLRALREEGDLTQRALGQKLRKPQSWVYNCETGNRRVDIGEFCDWVEACGGDPVAAIRRYLREAAGFSQPIGTRTASSSGSSPRRTDP